MVDLFSFLFFDLIGGLSIPKAPGEPNFFGSFTFSLNLYVLLPIIPIIGALIVGYIIYNYAIETEGSGLDNIINSYHNDKGKIRKRVPLAKLITSSITIGVGGSVGKEGPAGQIGGGLGSALADKFKLSIADREILLLTGAAACLGAVFKSPFGAAFFIIEVMYLRDYEVEAFIPAIAANFIAYGVYASVIGWGPLFSTPIYNFIPAELPLFVLLGLVCGLVGILFINFFSSVKNKIFKKISVPNWIKPALGMIFISICFILFPLAVGTGYGYIQEAINGFLPIEIILILIVMKILATTFTIASGNSGGDFAPSLVIGGLIGGAFSVGVQALFPSMIVQPGIFIIVGMGAFISAIAKTPIAAIIMVSEMTGSYIVLAPAILAAVISYVVSYKKSIYETQVPDRTYSLAHISSLITDTFTHIPVSKIMTSIFVSVSANDKVKKLEELFTESGQHSFPVLDENNELEGVIGIDDIVNLSDPQKEGLTIREIEKTVFIYIFPNDNVKLAFHKFITSGLSIIPVVDQNNIKNLIAMVHRKDIEKIMDL